MGALEGRPGPRVRRRRTLRLAGPLLAVLVLGGAVALDRGLLDRGDGGTPGTVDLTADPDVPDDELQWAGFPVTPYAHEDEPWFPDHVRELLRIPVVHDYALGHRLGDVEGETVNHRDGRRVSYVPDDPELTVWFFGGSTTYGIGQRDGHTIPSEVARAAERDGVRLEPVNFGVSGDVNWTETLRFAEALTSDLPRPDLVVFYDGSNDTGLASLRVDIGSTDPSTMERLPLSEGERELHAGSFQGAEPVGDDERGEVEVELAATQYGRGVQVGRALAAEAGVPVVHLWQPQPYAKVPSPADDELYRRLRFDPDDLPGGRAHYAAIRARSGADPVDLSGVFDEVDVPIYFDGSHTNELGARLVAEAAYEVLAPTLRDLAEP